MKASLRSAFSPPTLLLAVSLLIAAALLIADEYVLNR